MTTLLQRGIEAAEAALSAFRGFRGFSAKGDTTMRLKEWLTEAKAAVARHEADRVDQSGVFAECDVVTTGEDATQPDTRPWADLLRDVMEWHADVNSSDYNLCDDDPCEWCVLAKAALDGAARPAHSSHCEVLADNNTLVEVDGSMLSITGNTSGDLSVAVMSSSQRRAIASALLCNLEAQPRDEAAERARFEVFAKAHDLDIHLVVWNRGNAPLLCGTQEDYVANLAWEAWQESKR